jgi:hypothetical protein
MLKEIKFVQGAVSRKDFVPALNHFHIKGGKILGYNGAIALSTPIDLNIDCSPKATPFVKAIQTCTDTVELHMTPNGRLAVRSGKFTAYVDCIEEGHPNIEPEGTDVKLDGSLLPALKILGPFVAEDASRPWSRGVLFRGNSAFATNNIIAVEHWLGYQFPVDINIPVEAIDEILRIDEEPIGLKIAENSATFIFEGDRWLRCQFLSTSWPAIDKILEKESNCIPIPEGLYKALEDLKPFVDDLRRVHFFEGRIATSPTDGVGASVDIQGLPAVGCFNIAHLMLLEGIANRADFSMHPNPCIFYGDKTRGAIVGMTYIPSKKKRGQKDDEED